MTPEMYSIAVIAIVFLPAFLLNIKGKYAPKETKW